MYKIIHVKRLKSTCRRGVFGSRSGEGETRHGREIKFVFSFFSSDLLIRA